MTSLRSTWVDPEPHSAASVLRRQGVAMCSSSGELNGADNLIDALQSFPDSEAAAWAAYDVRRDREQACPKCRDAVPHAFLVKLATDDGDQWTATVPSAIGPHDAEGVAEDIARKQGYVYPQAYHVEHAA